MRWPVALSVLGLMTLLLFGCGRSPSPPASPGPTGGGPAKPADDPVALIKAVQAAASSGGVGGASAGGTTNGVMQVGSHKLKITIDVPVSYSMQDESAVVNFDGRKMVVEFDKGRVLLDDAEQAKLPDGAKDVEVQFLGGKLAITADGAAVLTPSAPK